MYMYIFMSSNDLVSNMLSSIRNANLAGFEKVLVPYTKMSVSVVKILKEEGFIDSFDFIDNLISIKLKFKKGSKHKPYISFIKKVSKPGLRVYVKVNNIPKILGGIGVAILSTSKGLVTNKLAKLKNVGGEFLFYIW